MSTIACHDRPPIAHRVHCRLDRRRRHTGAYACRSLGAGGLPRRRLLPLSRPDRRLRGQGSTPQRTGGDETFPLLPTGSSIATDNGVTCAALTDESLACRAVIPASWGPNAQNPPDRVYGEHGFVLAPRGETRRSEDRPVVNFHPDRFSVVAAVARDGRSGGRHAACVAPPGVDSRPRGDSCDDQPGDRVSPTPTEEAVHGEADEQDRREVRAHQSLLGLCVQPPTHLTSSRKSARALG